MNIKALGYSAIDVAACYFTTLSSYKNKKNKI